MQYVSSYVQGCWYLSLDVQWHLSMRARLKLCSGVSCPFSPFVSLCHTNVYIYYLCIKSTCLDNTCFMHVAKGCSQRKMFIESHAKMWMFGILLLSVQCFLNLPPSREESGHYNNICFDLQNTILEILKSNKMETPIYHQYLNIFLY